LVLPLKLIVLPSKIRVSWHAQFVTGTQLHGCPLRHISLNHLLQQLSVAQPKSAHLSGEVVALTGQDHSALEAQVQAAFLKGMRDLMGRSEDVGGAFAEEARKIHYKEAPERSIRGQTTLDEAESLRDEGIEVLSVPMIPAFKNTLQ
jgi:hypothetical protein